MIFTKKIRNSDTIENLREFFKTYKEEIDCYGFPQNMRALIYLNGNPYIDNMRKTEIDNFNLNTILKDKKKSLFDYINDNPKIRISFIYALNNIKSAKNLEDDDSTIEFLKKSGNLFISSYIDNFRKSAEKYKKLIDKNKLPEHTQMQVWIEDNNLCFVDNILLYLGKFQLDIDDVISFYQVDNDDVAKTVLEYKENGYVRHMNFNLSSYNVLLALMPNKAKKDS